MSLLGLDAVLGAGIACLVVGAILARTSRRLRVPFAAVGFASVVSLLPGVFLFRMSSGMVQIQRDAASTTLPFLDSTLSDGMTAFLIIIAMTIGLVIPRCVALVLGGPGRSALRLRPTSHKATDGTRFLSQVGS